MEVKSIWVSGIAILLLGCSADSTEPAPVPVAGHKAVNASVDIEMAAGQLIYVPVYSHVYYDARRRPFNLVATLSIRNTDTDKPITVQSVRYYDSAGKLVRNYLDRGIELAPLATVDYVVDEKDDLGSGTSFLVEWAAETEVHEPIVEAVMISTALSQGLSFTCPGRVIRTLHQQVAGQSPPA